MLLICIQPVNPSLNILYVYMYIIINFNIFVMCFINYECVKFIILLKFGSLEIVCVEIRSKKQYKLSIYRYM